MRRKKILAIGPITPCQSDLTGISQTLHFLDDDYDVNFQDSLESVKDDVEREAFFESWRYRIKKSASEYDGFIGFSFGGVILQQCFMLPELQNKPIVLFSVPSFIDAPLKHQLDEILHLIEIQQLQASISLLNKSVFYPYEVPSKAFPHALSDEVTLRMFKGFSFILDTDSRDMLNSTQLDYLHFVGDQSRLVNRGNISLTSTGEVHFVPESGMRVLQDNPSFCISEILRFLSK